MDNNERNILLFDGICNLCNGLVHFIIKRDPKAKFRFAALQSKTGEELLIQMNLPTDEFNTIIYIRGGKCFSKSSAIIYVLNDIGGIWKLFYGFIVIPHFIRDFVYASVARIRYKVFGIRETCLVPTPDIQDRFLF